MLLVLGCSEEPPEGRAAALCAPVEMPAPAAFGMGPTFQEELTLSRANPEPVFLTAIRVRAVDEAGKPLPPGGPSLDWWELAWAEPDRHGPLIGRASIDAPTILRASGADPGFSFPKGYALPLFSNETLLFRGGWSSARAWPGKARAELQLDFSRARHLREPPQAVFWQAAWAGGAPLASQAQSWLVEEGESLQGRLKLPADATVIGEVWLKGPGVGSVKRSEDFSPQSKTVVFSAPESAGPRPTALGVNLLLLDKEWPGWK